MGEAVIAIDQTTTTQTSASGAGGGLSALSINIGYFRSLPGILKLIQIVLGIFCMSCASPAYIFATDFFLFVCVISFIVTLIWILEYFLGIREALNRTLDWTKLELLTTSSQAVLYFIAFVVQLTEWSALPNFPRYGINIAAGVFGVFNFIAYAAGAYLIYLQYNAGIKR